MTAPYWTSDDGRHVLYCGDCLEILPGLSGVDAVVTDPPYGISYSSGMTGHNGGTALPGIAGDLDTTLRDAVLAWASHLPAIVFGTWKVQRPERTRAVLIWEKGDHVGMGDLSLPWKPNTEEIYIVGRGFSGHRGSSVLRFSAPVSWNSVAFGRVHPHQKPVALMSDLIRKVDAECICDPFAGSCSTALACMRDGRRFIGIELDEAHSRTAVKRMERELAQPKLPGMEPERLNQLELIA